jgi:hypothetical protein
MLGVQLFSNGIVRAAVLPLIALLSIFYRFCINQWRSIFLSYGPIFP